MKISPITNTRFSGIYRVERDFIDSATDDFINRNNKPENKNIYLKSFSGDYDNLYILLKDDVNLENEFENCLKKDRARFWKVATLADMWKNSDVAYKIFHTAANMRKGLKHFDFCK